MSDRDGASDLHDLLVSSRRDPAEHDALIRSVLPDLKAIAHRALRSRGGALQTTELVNEAWVKLFARNDPSWADRVHFFAIAARAMREVLVDQARTRLSQKRGGGWQRITLGSVDSGGHEIAYDLLDLDQVLRSMGETFPREATIVELRFFGGMDFPEIAEALDVSLSTVKREWRFARAWLASRLAE
ncbi:MAG: ECF-type sigma factor [Planctomycetota bacterium]